jgi:alanine dehydrogenase
MDVGIPRELKDHEYRVAITPVGVRELTDAGHRVLVEQGAGLGSSITDLEFEKSGATVLETADEVWAEADLILKVKEPVPEEFHRLHKDQVLFTYLHLAASREVTEALLKSGTTAVAYETVELADGRLPLLAPMSEVAGRMAPQVGAHLLERESGGRGVLMGGVSGVAAAKVLVLGGGMAGQNAAWIAQGMEAEVTLLDKNVDKLRYVDQIHKGRIVTLMSNRQTIEDLVLGADLVIGSVLIPGAKAPRLVTAEHVRAMKRGAVLVDISIDQGGCFETSHVTPTPPTWSTGWSTTASATCRGRCPTPRPTPSPTSPCPTPSRSPRPAWRRSSRPTRPWPRASTSTAASSPTSRSPRPTASTGALCTRSSAPWATAPATSDAG